MSFFIVVVILHVFTIVNKLGLFLIFILQRKNKRLFRYLALLAFSPVLVFVTNLLNWYGYTSHGWLIILNIFFSLTLFFFSITLILTVFNIRIRYRDPFFKVLIGLIFAPYCLAALHYSLGMSPHERHVFMQESIAFRPHYFMDFLNAYIFFWTIALSVLMVRLVRRVRILRKQVFSEKEFAVRYRFSFHLAVALLGSSVLTVMSYILFPLTWAEMIIMPVISNLLMFYVLFHLIDSRVFDVNDKEVVRFTGLFKTFTIIERPKTQQLSRVAREIESYLQSEKPFLQEDFSLSILSGLMQIPGHQISAILKNEFDTTFPNLVKDYRVKELQKQLLDPESKHLSIEGIGKQCGFRSKSVMYTQFKEMTGKTPAQFVKAQS